MMRMDGVQYRSAFADWNRQASVVCSRTSETFPSDEDTGRWLFPPRLVPWSQHPLIISKGPHAVQQVLACHLLDHLEFTDTLENELITPVCYMLARRAGGLDLPLPMVADARKIAVDEVHHALLVTHLASQVSAALGLGLPRVYRHPFLQQVDDCLLQLPTALHALLRFMAACVSETLITATLASIPGDCEVATAVRNTLRIHAEDEARHHVYFAKAIEVVWPQLPPLHRSTLGPFLPSLIRAFVSPNPAAVLSCLQTTGLSRAEAQRVVDETGPGANYRPNPRMWEQTLRCFSRGGAFEDGPTAEACAKAGLRSAVA
jgi:hypothetical protein